MSSIKPPGASVGTWILVGLVVVAGMAGGGAVWGLPQLRKEQRHRNERMAFSVLSSLRDAEEMFRSADKDQNGVEDFWTGDLAGLFRYGPVHQGVAEADAAPLRPLVPKPVAYYGYFFVALDRDLSVRPPEPYRQDTDGRSGKVHHRSKFGFCAYPEQPGVTGRTVYIVNENRTVFFSKDVPPPQDWPDDDTLKRSWSRE